MITKGIPKRSDTIQVASFLDIFKFNGKSLNAILAEINN